MATRTRSKRPACAGVLRDGRTPCNNSAKAGDTLCGSCRYREDNGDVLSEPVPVTWEPAASEAGDESVDPAQFREQLAADLAEDYAIVRTTLRDAMSESARRGTAQCPGCKTKIPVDIPDWGARVKAVQTWTELGFGRVRESVGDGRNGGGQHRHSFTARELDTMTVDELDALLAQDDPRETTAEALLEAAAVNPDGTATVPAAEWKAFQASRREWAKVVEVR